MNKFIENIILWFKRRFGVQVEEKTASELVTDFHEINTISVTAALAERLTTLTLSDGGISIEGASARADYIGKFAGRFYKTVLNSAVQVCLGTGDVLLKPNTDGQRFGIDVVENSDFRVVSSIGDFINAVLIRCDTMKRDNHFYERWEYHELKDTESGQSYEQITQVCFKDGEEYTIENVPGWNRLKEVQIIPNVDRLLLGRIKCPKLNREDVNSPNGVPITYGQAEIILEAKQSWRRFNQEFADKETMIFADKSLFKSRTVQKRDADGTITQEKISTLPTGKDRVIMDVNGSCSVDGQPLIYEYSPAIRDASIDAEIERNFRMLEMFCGLSEGILSKSTITYTNVDEVRKSTQATFAFITNLRDSIEQGVNDLLYAIDMLCNANGITPIGNWSAVYGWSDSYVESMTERFNELLQAHGVSVISDAELRAWVMNENVEQAQEWLNKNMGEDELTNADNVITPEDGPADIPSNNENVVDDESAE